MLRRSLVLLAALLALAAVPAVASANGNSVKPFSASGTIVRTEPGTAGIDPATGGLLTTGQIFQGDLSSDWNGLDGAGITVNQSSLIGIDPVALATTGSSPLFGQAWGTFDIAQRGGAIAGGYTAEIGGTLYLDPFGATFGCPATTVLGPIDIDGDGQPDPVGAFVTVEDTGAWQVTPNSATGRLKRIGNVGGVLLATAGGCLEGDESAEITLTGQLVPPGQNDRDRDDDDDDDRRGRGGDDDDDDDDDDRKGRGDDEDEDEDEDDDRKRRGDRNDDRRGRWGR